MVGGDRKRDILISFQRRRQCLVQIQLHICCCTDCWWCLSGGLQAWELLPLPIGLWPEVDHNRTRVRCRSRLTPGHPRHPGHTWVDILATLCGHRFVGVRLFNFLVKSSHLVLTRSGGRERDEARTHTHTPRSPHNGNSSLHTLVLACLFHACEIFTHDKID